MKLAVRFKIGNPWLVGAITVWSLLFLACATVNRTIIAPHQIPGAEYVGTNECATCHNEVVDGFKHATHAAVGLKTSDGIDISCESCHGPGGKHVKAGGGKNTINNPARSPETCYTCHLDKRGEFSLPHAHPVASGQVTCSDCHDPHKGHVVARTGADLEAPNETCTRCHAAQKGPFLFKHNAMVEGCTVCHNPHGSVNQKMLVARDSNLCLRCHLEHPATVGNGTVIAGGEDHRTRMKGGTCWIAGCHEDVHGSNASKAMRY